MRITINITIFTVCVVLALTMAASIIALMHSSQRESALIAATEVMDRSSQVLRLKVEALIKPAEALARRSKGQDELDHIPDADGHPADARFLSLLHELPQLTSIYIGFDNGAFYMLGATHARSPKRLKSLSAPARAKFIEQIVYPSTGGPKVVRHFLDENGKTLGSNPPRNTKYDPRTRPWYVDASKSGEVFQTEIYNFAGNGKPGITMSRRNNNSVFGVDITLGEIEDFLNQEPQAASGILSLFRLDGEVFAKTTTSADEEGAHQALIGRLRIDPAFRSGTFELAGEPWIAHVERAPIGTDTDEMLAIALPVAVIAKPINRASQNTMIIAVLVVLISLPIIWIVSRILSGPLIRLAAEAERMVQFDLEAEPHRDSVVDEIRTLQQAMSSMRSGLRIANLYVPKTLVRRLIEREEQPELGGDKKFITVLFMDMENFTAMSSKLPPEDVMSRMSEYFEIVTQLLLDHGATIDKYIGDAVMAFWNAPDDTQDHVALGCQAALSIVKAANKATQDWSEDEALPIRTRIGLHCGEATVGNVGSSDRMSYTALGSTVNLASRLETKNRDLKTDILVSKDVVDRVGQRFEFRDVEHLELKGIDGPTNVYELVADQKVDT
ncbi:MAG: adenylate/guanylate cyclase domain-containing protein [Rhizobiaceae bacterium]